MAEFLGPAIEVAKCIAAPIKRQFNYLCCFDSNIQELKDEANNLDDARIRLQTQVIFPEAKRLLRKADDIKDNVSRIENEIPNAQSQSGWLSIKARFALSKRAKKAAERMKELREQSSKFITTISQPAPPAARKLVPLGTTYDFESRKRIEAEIMETLKEEGVNIIGICGMEGVGKTTMAKRIMKRAMEEREKKEREIEDKAKEEKEAKEAKEEAMKNKAMKEREKLERELEKDCFHEFLMVVIGQKGDKLRIQLEIAESLGLKFEEQILSARAAKLCERLKNDKKRKLLVLDDVWKGLKLEDIGIPCESDFEGCKIILTSLNRYVLSAMNVQKVYGLQTLSEEEARFLFREKAGTCVDDVRLHSIPEKVIEECKGLPLALATVGRALKDENNIHIWKDVLQQLKNSNPEDIPDLIAEVYNPVKLSYDFLENKHAKSLFLLCCLFPEDENIPLEYLTYFAMGMGMFERIRNLEEARNRTYRLIKMLKDRFLLLDARDEYHVRMHDVIRDVSIFIASKNRFINCNDCTWISSFLDRGATLPVGLGFPNLRLLLINNEAKENFQISEDFIEASRELNVLYIAYGSLRSLPDATQTLKNLRTLFLNSCTSLETISVVGQLVSLEILICRDCTSIKEFPLEMRSQNSLRLIQLSGCRNLETASINSRSGATVFPLLESLWLEDIAKLEEVSYTDGPISSSSFKNLKGLTLKRLPALKSLWKSPYQNVLSLSSNTSSIEIFGCDSLRNLFLLSTSAKDCLLQLEMIEIRSCSMMEQVFLWNEKEDQMDIGPESHRRITFPKLKTLILSDLPRLTTFCQGTVSIDFKNLKKLKLESLPALKYLSKSPYQNALSLSSNISSIEIFACDSLSSLFSLSRSAGDFLQLEMIEIRSCSMVEQIFLWNEEEDQMDIGYTERLRRRIKFPKLKTLILSDLPRLTTFCTGTETIDFPNYFYRSISECPQFKIRSHRRP